MENFRSFLETVEEFEDDIEKTLAKLPKSHRNLVKGYHWRFQNSNTLNGDQKHVGLLDSGSKTITIAAPWYHSRELTVLHEVAHLVWEQLISDEQKNHWKQIVKNTKMKKQDRQNPEELFCMSYGAFYTKHTPMTFAHKEWMEFIQSLS